MSEKRTGLPVDPTSSLVSQIAAPFIPVEYETVRPYEVKASEIDDMGGYTAYREVPGEYRITGFGTPPIVSGGIELFKQFMDDPAETAGGIASAVGTELKEYPARQLRTALSGGETFNPETGEVERFDPFAVPATVAAGTARSIARTAGDEGGTVLGIMGGRKASSGAQKEKKFIDAKNRGLSDRDAYAETTGYIEPSDNVFRFEIDTSNAKLSKNYFEDSPVRDTEGIPYQRFQFEKFEQAEGRPPTLSDMLDFKELYEQYPDIGSVKVKRVPLGSAMDVKAAYDPIEKVIYVGTAGPKKMISNILHEVQHVVQHKEGFVSGSSVARYLPEGFMENFKALQTSVLKNSEDLLSSKTGFFKKKSLEDRAKEKDLNVYKFNLGKKAKAYFEGDTENYDYVDFSEFASKEELQELQKIAKNQTEVDSLELQVIKAGRQYFRQPGEVEARTVQKKFEEGRQGEFPLDVQDVAPEDYIYRIDGKPGVSEMSADRLPTQFGEGVGGQALIPTMPNRFFFEDLDMSELTLRPSLDVKGNEIPNSVDIELVRAGKKGKGHGTEIMRRLTKMADETDTALTLYPTPYGDGGLELEDLVAFYKKQGFEYLDPDPDISDLDREMVRYPRKAEGGIVSLLDVARNTGRGPMGVASLASTARNMNRPMVS